MFATATGKTAHPFIDYLQTIKRAQLLALLFLFTGSFSCEKEISVSGKYAYSQTQCADKWAHGNTEDETKANMIDYLSSKGIRISGAVLTDPPAGIGYCQACTCVTGRTFIIDVIFGSNEALEKEGFIRVN